MIWPAIQSFVSAIMPSHIRQRYFGMSFTPVSYTHLDVYKRQALGHPTPVDADASVASVLRGHGGYCFHLNGAFAWLLERLGYAVQHHRAGVQGARAATPVGADGNPLALTVDVEGQPWLVDIGLGSAVHEPLPLAPGRYRQGPFDYGIRPSEAVLGGWRFDHDPSAESFVGMDLDIAPVSYTHLDVYKRQAVASPTPAQGAAHSRVKAAMTSTVTSRQARVTVSSTRARRAVLVLSLIHI